MFSATREFPTFPPYGMKARPGVSVGPGEQTPTPTVQAGFVLTILPCPSVPDIPLACESISLVAFVCVF